MQRSSSCVANQIGLSGERIAPSLGSGAVNDGDEWFLWAHHRTRTPGSEDHALTSGREEGLRGVLNSPIRKRIVDCVELRTPETNDNREILGTVAIKIAGYEGSFLGPADNAAAEIAAQYGVDFH